MSRPGSRPCVSLAPHRARHRRHLTIGPDITRPSCRPAIFSLIEVGRRNGHGTCNRTSRRPNHGSWPGDMDVAPATLAIDSKICPHEGELCRFTPSTAPPSAGVRLAKVTSQSAGDGSRLVGTGMASVAHVLAQYMECWCAGGGSRRILQVPPRVPETCRQAVQKQVWWGAERGIGAESQPGSPAPGADLSAGGHGQGEAHCRIRKATRESSDRLIADRIECSAACAMPPTAACRGELRTVQYMDQGTGELPSQAQRRRR